MEQKQETDKQIQKIQANQLDLYYIRQDALHLYKTTTHDPRMDAESYLSQCWTVAVTNELKRKGLIDFSIEIVNPNIDRSGSGDY